jgi:hypothetical protein
MAHHRSNVRYCAEQQATLCSSDWHIITGDLTFSDTREETAGGARSAGRLQERQLIQVIAMALNYTFYSAEQID